MARTSRLKASTRYRLKADISSATETGHLMCYLQRRFINIDIHPARAYLLPHIQQGASPTIGAVRHRQPHDHPPSRGWEQLAQANQVGAYTMKRKVVWTLLTLAVL